MVPLSAGSTDHLAGSGARQVLDGHLARVADLILDVLDGRARTPAAGSTRQSVPPLAKTHSMNCL